MIQDLAPKTFSNVFAIKTPNADDLVFVYQKGKPLLYKQAVPTFAIMQQFFPASVERAVYLFCVDEINGFLIADAALIEQENGVVLSEMPDFSLEDLRIFRTLQPTWQAFMGITGSHLEKWYTSNKFCGCCGTPMVPSTKERAMVCPTCNFTDYPKICPAVIVAVTCGDKILLTKYANRAFTRYALIAGFCEIGESIEQTVHREVLEEVGVHVKNLTYYASQPWGFSESLLLGFVVELEGEAGITLDREELAEGVWVDRADVPDDTENSLSLTYTMMQAFKQGKI